MDPGPPIFYFAFLSMPKYQIIIAYDGTHYAGWQIQPNGTSIQAVIEDRLAQILQHRISLVGASRTDARVHANGQSAHFVAQRPFDPHRLTHALNGLLPVDIRILQIREVPEEFHSRYSATRKIYRYSICTARVQPPFTRHYQWHYPFPLDVAAMRRGSRDLVGRHDFTSFANAPTQGSVARDPVRLLMRLDIVEAPDLLIFEFEGGGFLYRMVRNLIGTLVECGSGKPRDLKAILQGRDRRLAGPSAPPHGLCLERVFYD